ncbi:MAG: glycerophosphodiester phosphodiesterase family protein [Roseivirga sp.]|nr:glycerophosphodiester phosphodiesterase family protein [Roseivirga sp.]
MSLLLRFCLLSFALLLTACSQSGSYSVEVEYDGKFNEAAFSLNGPKGFYSWTADRIPMVSAHRGGPYPGYPENAIATFDYIAGITPAVIECDIEMTKDSILIMMHDNTLDRTTTGTGKVRDYNWSELRGLKLVDNTGTETNYSIPTLREVLQWVPGKALLTLDVKRGVPFEKVIAGVQETNTGSFSAIITYSANDAQKVYQLDPSLMISVGIGNVAAYEAHRNLGIPDENMIAFVGLAEPEEAHYQFLHEKGIYCILGVLGNLDKKAEAKGDSIYAGFVKRGADILATDRPIEASKMTEPLIPETSSKRKYFNGY